MRFLVIAIGSIVLFFPAFWLFDAVVGPNWGAGIAAVAMYIAFPVLALTVWPAKKAPSETSLLNALEEGTLARHHEAEARDCGGTARRRGSRAGLT